MRLVPPALNVDVISASVACLLPRTILARLRWSQSLSTCGRPLRCPRWVEMPSTNYSRYTRDTVDRGMLNDRTTSEMECPIRLAPTIMPRSDSDNSRGLAMSRLAGVQPDSWENTSQLILLWAFPSRQETVAPLKNKFTYCYPMTFGTWEYIAHLCIWILVNLGTSYNEQTYTSFLILTSNYQFCLSVNRNITFNKSACIYIFNKSTFLSEQRKLDVLRVLSVKHLCFHLCIYSDIRFQHLVFKLKAMKRPVLLTGICPINESSGVWWRPHLMWQCCYMVGVGCRFNF
jgi:hypothetical protein